MRRLLLSIFLVGYWFNAGAIPSVPQKPTNGQALAERLRSAWPEQDSQVHGKLIIQTDDQSQEIPISCRVTVNSNNWESSYQTDATAQAGPEHLVVIHTSNAPNQYLYARAPSPSAPLPALAPIPPSQASIPLAGSDFSLADLGLDFLHWPGQLQFKGEMRLGQPCYVLESSKPEATGIVRVKSYIDEETGGPLIADAYDADGHLVKEYSLHGSSFKKVNGQWRLEKMGIRNFKTHSQTEMKFDVD